MFDDLPKRSPLKKFLSIVVFLLIIGGAGYFLYQKYAPANRPVTPKVLPTKIIESSSLSPTPTPSPTPSISATP